MLKISNKVNGCQTAPLEKFQNFQGGLKTIEKKNLRKLAESIKRHGFTAPLFIWQGNILDGHQRKLALEYLKEEGCEIPEVPYVEIEAENQVEAKKILLTYVSQYGDIDRKGLEEFISQAGISATEIAEFTILPLDKLVAGEVEADDYEIDLSKPQTRTQVGQLWQLGNHRLIVGDSTDPKIWERLMEGRKGQMCFTDPPYNVDYHSRGEGLKSQGKASIENDKMDDSQFEAFLRDFAIQLRENLQENAGTYVCYSSSKHIQFETALRAAGFTIRNQIIWAKEVASMGWGDYRWRHEPILYLGIDNGKETFFEGDRSHTTVLGDKEDKICMTSDGNVAVQINGQLYEVAGGGGDYCKEDQGRHNNSMEAKA